MKNKVQNAIKQAAFILTTLLLMLAFMPVSKAEAKKIEIYDPDTGGYIWVEEMDGDDDDEDSADGLSYEEWAEYFDWEQMSYIYSSVAKKPKSSLYKVSKKYNGWKFAGTLKEVKAACKDNSVKYICIIPEYYSGNEIPKMSGSEDKILVLPEGKWTNKAKWKEVWLLDTTGYTEKASGSSIVLFKGCDNRHTTLTVGKKVKKVNVSFSDRAREYAEAQIENSGYWSSPADMPALDITAGTSSQVTIDATNIPGIGVLTAGKKSKVTLKGNAVKVTGNSKAKVTVKGCTYLGNADIPVTVADSKNGPQFFKEKMAGVTGPSGKVYNYVQMTAGGTVETSGYGLILNLPANAKKTKVYAKNEKSLPFAQLTFDGLPTPDNMDSFLPAVYIDGKKADSMLLAPTDLKAMLKAFDTVGIKMTDSKAEKVRKLHIWGHDYCWHSDTTGMLNEYSDDRDKFSQGYYAYFTSPNNLESAFYFRNTGCNAINEAMVLALNYLGVKSYAVMSYGLNHAMNLVELDDGKWYYVDTTPTPDTHFDLSVYPYQYKKKRYTGLSSAFHVLTSGDGTILDLGYDSREKTSTPKVSVKENEQFYFQKGTPTPDGTISDGYVKVAGCGLKFGDEYIGYRVAYKNGVYYWDGAEPEIIGFTDNGSTKDYGKGYKAIFAVYDEYGTFDYYTDADGNYYDWSFELMSEYEFRQKHSEEY